MRHALMKDLASRGVLVVAAIAIGSSASAQAQTFAETGNAMPPDLIDFAVAASAWHLVDVGLGLRHSVRTLLADTEAAREAALVPYRAIASRTGQDVLSLRIQNTRYSLSNGAAWLRLGSSRRRKGASLSLELTY